MTDYLYGAKGGQGTSTVAALLALDYARGGCRVTLSDASGDSGDLLALLGRAGGPDAAPIELGREGGTPYSVVDCRTSAPADLEPGDSAYLVLRGPCYLALRRALALPFRPTGVILVTEGERSLGDEDVRDVLGLPVLATIAVDPRIARMVDAGLLESRPVGRGSFTFPGLVGAAPLPR